MRPLLCYLHDTTIKSVIHYSDEDILCNCKCKKDISNCTLRNFTIELCTIELCEFIFWEAICQFIEQIPPVFKFIFDKRSPPLQKRAALRDTKVVREGCNQPASPNPACIVRSMIFFDPNVFLHSLKNTSMSQRWIKNVNYLLFTQ